MRCRDVLGTFAVHMSNVWSHLVPVAAPAQLPVLYQWLRLLHGALRHEHDAVREGWVAYAQLVVLDLQHTHSAVN
jgi:hypothetical protein